MRVRGNIAPEQVSVEAYSEPGRVEVRIRENVSKVTTTDQTSGESNTYYEYDEYTVISDVVTKEDVLKDLPAWIATGRSIETSVQESALIELQEQGFSQVALYTATGAEPTANSGIFAAGADPWEPGKSYAKGDLFSYNGSMGFVRQAHTSQAHWLPFSTGTESLYGARPAPVNGVFPYVYNMAADVGMLVSDRGDTYKCIQKIDVMTWSPADLPAHFAKV